MQSHISNRYFKLELEWAVFSYKVLERTCPEEHLNLSKSAFFSKKGHSGCKSQNIAIRALKGNFVCHIWGNGKFSHLVRVPQTTSSHLATIVSRASQPHARCSLGLPCTSSIFDIHVMSNWHLSKQDIRWPVWRNYLVIIIWLYRGLNFIAPVFLGWPLTKRWFSIGSWSHVRLTCWNQGREQMGILFAHARDEYFEYFEYFGIFWSSAPFVFLNALRDLRCEKDLVKRDERL